MPKQKASGGHPTSPRKWNVGPILCALTFAAFALASVGALAAEQTTTSKACTDGGGTVKTMGGNKVCAMPGGVSIAVSDAGSPSDKGTSKPRGQ